MPEEEPVDEQPTIDERLKELRGEGKENREIAQTLYQEGYSTHEIMKRHLPIRNLGKPPSDASDDDSVQAAIAGRTKGPGYIDEFRRMIQQEIGKTKELTEVFYDFGLGILFASLQKAGLSIEEFRSIAKKEGLRDTLLRVGETAFKALEYYESELITKVEAERDEARAYASILDTQVEELVKNLDPKIRLEKMIHTYLFSGNVTPDVLMALIDKWLSIELGEVKMEMLAR